jgi:hypothetical protein
MSVAFVDGNIVLSGRCPSDDAGSMVEHLLAHPEAAVDWRSCEWAHTAVVQVLLAARRDVLGPSNSEFLSRWVEPMLGPR